MGAGAVGRRGLHEPDRRGARARFLAPPGSPNGPPTTRVSARRSASPNTRRIAGFIHIGRAVSVEDRAAPAADGHRHRFSRVRRNVLRNRQTRQDEAAARSVQGDRRATADRLDFDASARRADQSRPLQFLQRLLQRARRSSASPARAAKDSASFARESGEFVANLATIDLRDPMNATSAPLPRGDNEFAHAGLTMAECRLVAAPRVAESPASLECKVVEIVEIRTQSGAWSGSVLTIGEVVGVHIDEAYHSRRPVRYGGRPSARPLRLPGLRGRRFGLHACAPERRRRYLTPGFQAAARLGVIIARFDLVRIEVMSHERARLLRRVAARMP